MERCTGRCASAGPRSYSAVPDDAAALWAQLDDREALAGLWPRRVDALPALRAPAEPLLWEGARLACTDGACAHPRLPGATTAAWAICARPAAAGKPALVSLGRVGGAQAAQRAELTAAVLGAEAEGPDALIVTDSVFLAVGPAGQPRPRPLAAQACRGPARPLPRGMGPRAVLGGRLPAARPRRIEVGRHCRRRRGRLRRGARLGKRQ